MLRVRHLMATVMPTGYWRCGWSRSAAEPRGITVWERMEPRAGKIPWISLWARL